MISVIIPTYRNAKYLDICIDSALANQDSENEIIVVVDGYYDESKEIIEKYQEINVIDLVENRGMQYAINIGVWNSSSEQIFVINDDNIFPMSWDSRLKKEFDKNKVVTVNQIEPTGPSMFGFEIFDCGKTAEEFDIEKFLARDAEVSTDTITSNGSIFPFYMSKKWFMAVGGLDTWYDSPNYCDWDFFAKLQLIPGLELVRTNRLHMYHFGSVSTKKNSEASSFIAKENYAMAQYQYKWKFAPYNGKNNCKFPPSEKVYL